MHTTERPYGCERYRAYARGGAMGGVCPVCSLGGAGCAVQERGPAHSHLRGPAPSGQLPVFSLPGPLGVHGRVGGRFAEGRGDVFSSHRAESEPPRPPSSPHLLRGFGCAAPLLTVRCSRLFARYAPTLPRLLSKCALEVVLEAGAYTLVCCTRDEAFCTKVRPLHAFLTSAGACTVVQLNNSRNHHTVWFTQSLRSLFGE